MKLYLNVMKLYLIFISILNFCCAMNVKSDFNMVHLSNLKVVEDLKDSLQALYLKKTLFHKNLTNKPSCRYPVRNPKTDFFGNDYYDNGKYKEDGIIYYNVFKQSGEFECGYFSMLNAYAFDKMKEYEISIKENPIAHFYQYHNDKKESVSHNNMLNEKSNFNNFYKKLHEHLKKTNVIKQYNEWLSENYVYNNYLNIEQFDSKSFDSKSIVFADPFYRKQANVISIRGDDFCCEGLYEDYVAKMIMNDGFAIVVINYKQLLYSEAYKDSIWKGYHLLVGRLTPKYLEIANSIPHDESHNALVKWFDKIQSLLPKTFFMEQKELFSHIMNLSKFLPKEFCDIKNSIDMLSIQTSLDEIQKIKKMVNTEYENYLNTYNNFVVNFYNYLIENEELNFYIFPKISNGNSFMLCLNLFLKIFDEILIDSESFDNNKEIIQKFINYTCKVFENIGEVYYILKKYTNFSNVSDNMCLIYHFYNFFSCLIEHAVVLEQGEEILFFTAAYECYLNKIFSLNKILVLKECFSMAKNSSEKIKKSKKMDYSNKKKLLDILWRPFKRLSNLHILKNNSFDISVMKYDDVVEGSKFSSIKDSLIKLKNSLFNIVSKLKKDKIYE
jgi:hypothetical protein